MSEQCAKDEYCDERRARCVSQICLPGTLDCDGGNVMQCNADGSDRTLSAACGLSQICLAGQCVDIVCVPNTQFCQDGDVQLCAPDGTTSSLGERCSKNEYCLEQGVGAICSPTICVPDAPLCVGDFATQCAADGSGPVAGGDDCTAANQVCYHGECRERVCEPGQKFCQHDDIYLCSENGTASTLYAACASNSEYCDDAAAVCRKRVCTPGALVCDGQRVATCDALGAGFLPAMIDCAAKGQLCEAGACEAIVCPPNQYFCQSSDIYLCNAQGTAGQLYQQCSPGDNHCEALGGGAYCVVNPCVPTLRGCNGNVASVCDSNGLNWISVTDCTTLGQFCQSGACVPQICTPNSYFCSGNEQRRCSYDGLSSFSLGQCIGDTYCLATSQNAVCQRTPCDANEDACLGDKLGTCSTDGLSLASVADDCAARGKLCTLQGCADQAVDVLGSGNQVTSLNQPLVGNQIEVQAQRTITQIEAYLSLPGTRALNWMILEGVPGQPFLQVFSATSIGTGTGFQSSGDMSYILKAGKTYLIGVSISGSYVAYYGNQGEATLLSFGVADGGFNSSDSPPVYSYPQLNLLFEFRLTTTP